MSSSENKPNRFLQTVILLLVVLFVFLSIHWYRSHTASVPAAVTPVPTPTSLPITPVPAPVVPKVIPVAPLPAKRLPVKALTPHPIPKTPGVPAIPVTPVVPVVPYQSYVAPPPPAEPQEWQGNDTAIKHDGQIVVKTDEQWSRFWVEHRPGDFSPDVDFSKNMVIGVFAGSRPAEQFTISIVGVRVVSGALVVEYQERTPPTGTLAIGVQVYPYDIKVIPRSNLQVKFIKLNAAAG